jgi:hypothetical protein
MVAPNGQKGDSCSAIGECSIVPPMKEGRPDSSFFFPGDDSRRGGYRAF